MDGDEKQSGKQKSSLILERMKIHLREWARKFQMVYILFLCTHLYILQFISIRQLYMGSIFYESLSQFVAFLLSAFQRLTNISGNPVLQ